MKTAIGAHTCHWPGCTVEVPPRMWGCKHHWYRLPILLRDRIWRTYRPGQEVLKNPSPEYLHAANAVQRWIKEHSTNEESTNAGHNPR